jgi:hypothetical protein
MIHLNVIFIPKKNYKNNLNRFDFTTLFTISYTQRRNQLRIRPLNC